MAKVQYCEHTGSVSKISNKLNSEGIEMENTITPNFDRAVCALRHILRINSVETDAEPGQPFGEGCAKALQFALELLQMFGFKTKNIDNYCGYGEIGEGELFAVLGHLDVVPAGDGWTYPPFEAELVDGKIYARGAIDDKGPVIA
ncbi:MAG: M20/M25/M40 family metallo-hydrolase, partial [Christensenellaceae bacterium]|nr:M20/M25/M40 family metallo-hydrolase [Christensenellaceae bacterium]